VALRGACFAVGRLATHSTGMFVSGYGFGKSGVPLNSIWRQNLAKSAMQFRPYRQRNYLKFAKFGEIAN
jgi:hypothetical protein